MIDFVQCIYKLMQTDEEPLSKRQRISEPEPLTFDQELEQYRNAMMKYINESGLTWVCIQGVIRHPHTNELYAEYRERRDAEFEEMQLTIKRFIAHIRE